jgi:hypothetical protein
MVQNLTQSRFGPCLAASTTAPEEFTEGGMLERPCTRGIETMSWQLRARAPCRWSAVFVVASVDAGAVSTNEHQPPATALAFGHDHV